MKLFYFIHLFGSIVVGQQQFYNNETSIELGINNEKQKIATLQRLNKELQNDNIVILFHDGNKLKNELSNMGKTRIILYEKEYKKTIQNLRKYEAYILLFNKLSDVQDFFDTIYNLFICNHSAKYIIFTDLHNHEDIFKIASKYFLFNLNIINKHYEMFTYFPYGKHSCGKNTEPIKLFLTDETLFPTKISTDMHGCSVKLLAMRSSPYVIDVNSSNKNMPELAGFETTIIHTILAKMNLTGDYALHPTYDWGILTPEGNFTSMYKELYEKKVDLLMGMHRGNETLEKYFDATVFVFDVTGCWFVPMAQQIAQWKNVTVIFEPIVWLSILIVIVSNGLAWWILGKNREIGASYNEVSLCLMGSFYILLQGSFTTPSAWKIRFVVMIWSMSSLLIFTAHQCQLTGILTSPLYEHQISNTEELINSKLGCGYFQGLKNFYSDKNNRIHRKILEKFVPCHISPACTNRSAFKRDLAVLKNKRQVRYLMPKWYSSKSGKPLLYGFKENEFLLLGKMYTHRGFPFLDKINDYVMILRSNGLIDKWDNDLAAAKKDEKESPQLVSLSLIHLQAAFYLLTLGLICSTFMFLGEEIYFKYSCHRKKIEVNITDENLK